MTIASKSNFYRCVPTALLDSISNALNGSNSTATNTTTAWATNLASVLNSRTTAQKLFQEIAPYGWILAVTGAIALILGFLWLFVLQFLSGFLVWFTVITSVLASYALTGFLFYSFVMLRFYNRTLISTGFPALDTNEYNQWILLTFAIICAIVALLFTILVCVFSRNLRIAIAVMAEAAVAVRSMPYLFLFPLLKTVFFAGIAALAVVVIGLLSTSGDLITQSIVVSGNNTIAQTLSAPFEHKS
jgi:hypothetical protein